MDIKINSIHFDADQKLEEFITKKITKLTARHDNITGVDVTLKLDNSQDRENKVAEIKISMKGNEFFSRKQTASFEESTDEVTEALRRQLSKSKEKKIGR